MNLAKVSANGQITVPVEVRRILGVKSGGKLLFLQNADGDIVMTNASASALRKAPKYLPDAEVLIAELPFELIPAVDDGSKLIRDAKDQPILNAAIVALPFARSPA